MQLVKKYKFFIWTLLLAGIAYMVQPYIGFVGFNQSDSLPQKLFFVTYSKANIQLGDLVAFRLNRGQEYQSSVLIKIIGGKAFDDIKIDNNLLYVNNKKIGKIQPTRRNGASLTPLQAQKIPAGKYFAYTPEFFSFDSRYQEIGLIDEKEIIGKAYALF